MALPITTPPAALTVVQQSTWDATDATSGFATHYDSTHPTDAQVHLAKAPLQVGQTTSGLAFVRELHMSVDEARVLNAHLTALLALVTSVA